LDKEKTKREEVALAKNLIEQYCKNQSLVLKNTNYDELARELVDLAYSLGGHGSEEILSKMLESFLKKMKGQPK
jgi:cytochrome c-type biogenesis protein CcmH/NrfF